MNLQRFIVRIYTYVYKRIPTSLPALNNLDDCVFFPFINETKNLFLKYRHSRS